MSDQSSPETPERLLHWELTEEDAMDCMRARASTILVVSALLALAPLAEAAGAGRTRPGGAGGGAGGSGRAASAPTRATGRATFGQHHGGHHHVGFGHGYFPYYRYPFFGYYGYPYGYYGFYGHYGHPVPYPPWGGSARGGPAAVETDVRPKKATVIVDGEEVGRAKDYNGRWDSLRLDPGKHVLAFEAPGRMRLEIALKVRSGRYYRIAHRLRPGEGLDPRSVLEVEDREGPQPTPASPSALAPGPQPEEPPGSLPRGFLRLRVLPADAAVYLDGSFLARADDLARLHGSLVVAEGEHRIEVVRPGYRSRSLAAVVKGGEPVLVELELERGE